MKPSIFSKDYEKKMRKMKIIRTIIILIVIVSSVIGYLNYSKKITFSAINFSAIKKALTPSEKQQVEVNTKTKKATKSVKKSSAPVKPVKKTITEEKSYSIKLSSGEEIKAVYEVNDNEKKFKYISPVDSSIDFNINPSGKAIIVFDKNSQSILYMNIDGNLSDITKNEYKAESDGTVYTKEDELKKSPSYIWCSNPRFIDDNTMAYISQLPYFNEKVQQYIWLYNIETKEYKVLYNNSASNIKLDKITDKGLMVSIDNNTKYLKSDGTLSD